MRNFQLESIVFSHKKLQAAWHNFLQLTAIVIAEVLIEHGIEDPTEAQVCEIWNAFNFDALFWEEWAENHRIQIILLYINFRF